MNGDGLRVIAVACKEVESHPGRQYGVADEDDMILHGFIAFLDPPKDSAGPAIAALRTHGVAIKIYLTRATTNSVARRSAETSAWIPPDGSWAGPSRRCPTPNWRRRPKGSRSSPS